VEIARLQIAVDALQARVAQVELDKLNKSAGRAETGTNKLSGSADKLGVALAGMVTASTLMAIQRLSEEFVLMQSRVGRLSESSDEAAVTYGRLSEIARTTGASLGDTVKLWEALNFTLKDLGGNNDQVIRFTETLQKIGAIGGNSAEEMSNALRQLGQALAGGVVRSEEFNSIIESMPALLREIAQGMGVPFGDLRQIMLDGGLTAEKVLQALQDRGMAVDQEFAKIPRTVSQAAESLRTDLGNAIAELDRTIGVSSGFAQLIDLLSEGIRFTAGDFTDLERLKLLTAERVAVQKSLEQANRRTDLSTKEQLAYDQRLAGINAQIVEIQDRRIKQIKQEAAEISGNSQKAADARAQTLTGLEEERKLAAMNAKERAQYKAEQLLGVGASDQEKEKARELAAQTYELANSHKSVVSQIKLRATEADKMAKAETAAAEANGRAIADLAEQLYQAGLGASELAQRQAELRLNDYAKPEQIASVRQLSAELQRLEDAKRADEKNKENTQLLGQVDPVFGEQQRFQKELEDLRVLNEAKLLEDVRYLDLKGQAERAHAEQMRLLQEENFRAQSMSNELLMASLDHLGQATTNVVTGLITGATNGEEAMRALAGAILNEAVGAVVQMGIQYVKSAIMGQSAAAAGAAASLALGASTSVALASMYAAPAALASLATMGANAAPAMAGITSTVGLSKAMALASFDGGGFTGTGSRSGGMDGKGGFMAMLHPNETVLDHTKGQGMGGGVTVNVIESRDKAGTQQTRTGADGKETVDVFVADIMGDGPRARAMQSAFGLSRQGR
jgi:tape measure domain-containing protein